MKKEYNVLIPSYYELVSASKQKGLQLDDQLVYNANVDGEILPIELFTINKAEDLLGEFGTEYVNILIANTVMKRVKEFKEKKRKNKKCKEDTKVLKYQPMTK